jgi:hypothetical protein
MENWLFQPPIGHDHDHGGRWERRNARNIIFALVEAPVTLGSDEA